MNKRINTNPHCFISIVGPGGCGKTRLVSELLLNQRKIFIPSFDRILYFYNHFQSTYESLLLDCAREKVAIEFHQGLHWSAVDKSEAEKHRTLVVLDDLFQDACDDRVFLNLVVAGRHRNIHLMVLKHNLYQPAKNSKTIDLNVTQLILFKSPRDIEQIGVLGRQMGERQHLLEAYKRATLKPFGYLLIDLDPQTDPKLKYSTNCSGKKHSIFFISTNKTSEAINNESTRLLYS